VSALIMLFCVHNLLLDSTGHDNTVVYWLLMYRLVYTGYWVNIIYVQLFVGCTERLEAKKTEEQESKFFTEMPSRHYMELTHLLLQ